MKKLAIAAAALLGFAAAGTAQAGAAGPGYVSYPIGSLYGATMFNQDGPRNGIPACGQGLLARWVLDTRTVAGQAQLSVLLSAYAMHKKVEVQGSGDCAVWGDTETVLLVAIRDD